MPQDNAQTVERYRRELEREYRERFPVSWRHHEERARFVLDRTSHAVRWNEPFVPVARSTEGAALVDLDGRRIVDYWQGHMANLLGHNPEPVRRALVETLEDGRGLQSGMVHEVEADVAERIARHTATEVVRFTTSGSLGTFYAALLARAFTGRSEVLKVGGGWHGSQPFGLKGIRAHGVSFEHVESEGLGASAERDIVVTRFADTDDLRRTFATHGDRLACFLLEPLLGAGGGMAAPVEYLREARRLTERHGALLVADEIITGYRFRCGDLCSMYGVTPDLLVLGKVVGGGMPVAAVAGRRDVLSLATRGSARVKFEGGTYSAHELSLAAARAMLRHLEAEEQALYPLLASHGERMREGLREAISRAGAPIRVLDPPPDAARGCSLVFAHPVLDPGAPIRSPEDLALARHRQLDEGLLKSTLMLEGVSTRSGLGAISTAHAEADFAATISAYDAALARIRAAGLV